MLRIRFYLCYANFITIGEPHIVYIYIYENYKRNYLEKKIENIKKNLRNKMCLEFNFAYAVQISSGSVNKYVTSRDAVTSL